MKFGKKSFAYLEAKKWEQARLEHLAHPEYQRIEQQIPDKKCQDSQDMIDQKQIQNSYDNHRYAGYSSVVMPWDIIRSMDQDLQYLRS